MVRCGAACSAFIRWLGEADMQGGIIIGFLGLLIIGMVLVLALGHSSMAFRMPM